MTVAWRWKFVLLIGMAMASGIPTIPGEASAARATFAGHWQWTLSGSCANSSRNRDACSQMLSMGVHVYSLKGSRLEFRGTDRITVDSSGRFTEKGSATVIGRTPGAPRLSQCDPAVMESQPFQASCRVSWSGTGHIAKGGTFLPDFYTDSGRLAFRGHRVIYYQSYRNIGDSLIPAVPGNYDTNRYINLVGTVQFMPGIDIRLTVAHTSQ